MPPEEEMYMPIYNSLPSRIAARIPLAELTQLMEKHFSSSDSRVMSKAMMLGVLAAEEALKDAGRETNPTMPINVCAILVNWSVGFWLCYLGVPRLG